MDNAAIVDLVIDAVKMQVPEYSGVIELSTPIGTEGVGLDSIGCLHLVLDIEQKTGQLLRDEHLTAVSLSTVGSLIEFVQNSR